MLITDKLTNIFSKNTFTRVAEFFKSDEVSKKDVIYDWIETKNVKDTPQILYSNQINIEQL